MHGKNERAERLYNLAANERRNASSFRSISTSLDDFSRVLKATSSVVMVMPYKNPVMLVVLGKLLVTQLLLEWMANQSEKDADRKEEKALQPDPTAADRTQDQAMAPVAWERDGGPAERRVPTSEPTTGPTSSRDFGKAKGGYWA